ncbi:hypothetical protein B0A49_08436 [Cryomyces minteri]|uniref:Kinetochore protein Spc24 n=1 Tax=Cryomyces minteri TaxID=331657 RepID=A0A4U0WTA2_9PEZI|nr:hypothetical protein B0A49_08436 [Cryomyces minteri]
MLLDEDPATLIAHTLSNFNTAPDRAYLSRIHSSLSTLQEARQLRVSAAEQALKQLSRQLSTVESQHALTVGAHNPTLHASEILALDTQKFRIAKAASDLEIEGERLEAELASLRSQLDSLEAQGIEGSPAANAAGDLEDETILRLRVYRSLGIDVERDRESGSFNKAVVRNREKGDVHVVNVDPKFSRFFYAEYFWGGL